jgi:predicted dehydrogenase
MFDMGPYYVSSLVHILGPVVRVTGSASRSRDTRVIATGPRAGQVIPVEIDTHISGVLEHTGGALSTITMSFDAVQTSARPIEVHGETASLSVPDPNGFGGDVEVYRLGGDGWETLEPSAGFVDGSRGIGLLDFLAGGERASGALGLHVLDVMSALIDSAHSGRRIDISSSVERPPLVPLTPAATWRGTERLR